MVFQLQQPAVGAGVGFHRDDAGRRYSDFEQVFPSSDNAFLRAVLQFVNLVLAVVDGPRRQLGNALGQEFVDEKGRLSRPALPAGLTRAAPIAIITVAFLLSGWGMEPSLRRKSESIRRNEIPAFAGMTKK